MTGPKTLSAASEHDWSIEFAMFASFEDGRKESEVVRKLVREQPEDHRFSHLSAPGRGTCVQALGARDNNDRDQTDSNSEPLPGHLGSKC